MQDQDTAKGQDWPLLTAKQQYQVEMMLSLGDDPKKALISRAMMLCPLPYRSTPARQVVQTCQVPGGVLQTTLTALDEALPLPFGDDAYVLDVASSDCRRRKTPVIEADNVAGLMRKLGLEHVGGENYKRFMQRLQRIGALGLRVKRPGQGAINARLVDLDGAEFWSNRDLAKEFRGERRLVPPVLRLSPEYFADLMSSYAAVPLGLLEATSGNPTQYALAKWLWWRADVAGTEGLIDWEELRDERGSRDSNIRRFRDQVKAVLTLVTAAQPSLATVFQAEKGGLRIRPLRELSSLQD